MPATRLSLLAIPALALGLLTPGAHGQCVRVLYTFNGDSPGDHLNVVSGAGDVNVDGYDDLIIGAKGDDNNGVISGSARVLSGLDGTILYSFDGDSAGDRFGSVSGAGDVNNDGYADVIVGASQSPTGAGYARVFSGVDGKVLYTFLGDSAGDKFGESVSGAGDLNADGFDDLIVGAPGDDNNGGDSGSARVFSGADGSVLFTFYGDSADDRFGVSVSGAGDVNGDGFDDLIVGARRDDNNGMVSGSARVFSGLDGSTLYTFLGDSPKDWFGTSVSGAGDVNNDGYADVIVGAPQSSGAGYARVFSGVDGSILYTFLGDSVHDFFGTSVSGAGDVNGDGFDDLICGAHFDDNNGSASGSARVISGVDGSILFTSDGDSYQDVFGISVSGAGDVNGDGFDDLIVGAWGDDNNGAGSGSARVFSVLSGPVGTSYCGPAVPNSTGLSASILALGSDTVADDHLCLQATDLPPNKWGYFLASETQGFVANPGGSQGNLCLGGKIGRFAKLIQESSKSGVLTIQVDLTGLPMNPPHTVLAGETWNFQAWYRDNNPTATSNFTDAVSVTFL